MLVLKMEYDMIIHYQVEIDIIAGTMFINAQTFSLWGSNYH